MQKKGLATVEVRSSDDSGKSDTFFEDDLVGDSSSIKGT
mgnify:FL=1